MESHQTSSMRYSLYARSSRTYGKVYACMAEAVYYQRVWHSEFATCGTAHTKTIGAPVRQCRAAAGTGASA